MLSFLQEVRKPTLELPVEERRKLWFKPLYAILFGGIHRLYGDVFNSQKFQHRTK